MQIHVHAHGFALTDALEPHARRRLHFAFDRLADAVPARAPVTAALFHCAVDPR